MFWPENSDTGKVAGSECKETPQLSVRESRAHKQEH